MKESSIKKPLKQVIIDFKAAHGDKYDYSKVEYKNSHTKVIIICHEHGEFEQRPDGHKDGRGCIACRNNDVARIQKEKSEKTLIADFKKVHGDKFDYSRVIYVRGNKKVIIICLIHGEFKQIPGGHKRGKGCPACGIGVNARIQKAKKAKTLIAEFKKIHGEKFDYSRVIYNGAFEKVTIICPEHGEFEQSPKDHKKGSGCPGCARGGFDATKSGILYYLRVEPFSGVVLYKIGITNRTVEQRFRTRDLSIVTVINTVHYQNGGDCLNAETSIKQKFKEFQYRGSDVLDSGNTELFTKDILNLDSNEYITINPDKE